LLFLYIRGNKKILSFICEVCFLASIFSAGRNSYEINRAFIKLSEYYTPLRQTEDTISPIFHFSKNGKNILVIMLDMAESVFIPSIFDESPELRGQFSGFTYFPNTITFNGWTKGGAPPIFGGYEYTPVELNKRPLVPLREKTNESLLLMPRILSGAGFSVTITDPPYADDNWIPDLRIYGSDSAVSSHITDGVYTDLWLKRNGIVLPRHSAVLKRNILWYSLFREAPLAFRQALYAHGTWCAPFSEYKMRLMLNGYAVLDYLDELTDFEAAENSSVLMVNNTTHENSFLQAPLYKPQLNVTNYGKSRFSKEVWYHVNAAAMKRLAEYFDFLKTNNVYDNTRIILVSDHAYFDASFVTKTSLPFHVDQFNALLMVKDFNAEGKIKTDMTFMTNADVPSLAMDGIIENPVNPFTGNPINGQKNPPFPVLIKRVTEISDTEIALNPQNIFYIKDNIFDTENWERAAK
jgi:hypothetical protein